ncbi:MAG: cache domain-containing protein [Bacteroidota bacterium]
MNPYKSTSISQKLVLYFVLLGMLTIGILTGYTLFKTSEAMLDRTSEQLNSIKMTRKLQVENFFKDRISNMQGIATYKEIQFMLKLLDNENIKPTTLYQEFSAFLKPQLNTNDYFNHFFLISSKGKLFECPTHSIGIEAKLNDTTGYNLTAIYKEVIQDKNPKVEDFQFIPKLGKNMMLVSAPVVSEQNVAEGIVCCSVSPEAINQLMHDKSSDIAFGSSGEAYIVGKDYLMRTQSRLQQNTMLKTHVKSQSVDLGLSGNDGTVKTVDYRKMTVLSSYSPLEIKGLKWVILAEMDYSEVIVPIVRIRNQIILLFILISILFFVVTLLISRKITKPIIQLQKATQQVGSGEFELNLEVQSHDEIGELTLAFNRMAEQLKQQTDENYRESFNNLSSMIDGQEFERQRLSRELHDGLGQSLIAIKLKLESINHTDMSKIRYMISHVKELFDKTIDDIRRISNDLMPTVLNEFGLEKALRRLCSEISEYAKIRVLFNCEGDFTKMSKRDKMYTYRIVQEGLNNIHKYAEASEASINLKYFEKNIVLDVKDNGKGFTFDSHNLNNGNGIRNMSERAHLLEGNIEIITSPGQGTHIHIEFPYSI